MHWRVIKEIREKLSVALTGNAESRSVFIWSLMIGSAATIASLPHFHYLLFGISGSEWASREAEAWKFLFGQTMLLFLVLLLSCMTGLAFSRRHGLPGLGDPSKLRKEFKGIASLGLVMAIVSLIAFDIWFFDISPSAYPANVFYALSLPFKGAFTEEVILRLCMVTLAVGIIKRKWVGIFIVSVLAPFLSLKYFRYMGLEGLPFGLLTVQFLLSFASNMILGIVFVTRGLFSCMVLKFFLNLKYIAIYFFF